MALTFLRPILIYTIISELGSVLLFFYDYMLADFIRKTHFRLNYVACRAPRYLILFDLIPVFRVINSINDIIFEKKPI